MKTNSSFARSLTAVHLAAVLTLSAPAVFAQPAAPNPETEQQRRARSEAQRAAPTAEQAAKPLFDIEIADGTFTWKGKKLEATLENVVDMVRDRHEGANIVLSPGLPRIKIASLKLRATSVDQELEALRVASGGKFMWNGPNTSPAAPPIGPNQVWPDARNEKETPLFILSELPANLAPPGRQVEVFNLTDYFNSLGSPDEENHQKLAQDSVVRIQEIIARTLGVVDEDHNASMNFQFHAGANLLVVAGTPDALDVARKVISALSPQARAVGSFPSPFGMGGSVGQPNPFSGALPSAPGSVASAKARRAIMNKLETIRLDSVMYDGLPLAEVVRHLIAEAKKHDPQNVGINFLVNPNPPPANPVGSPPGVSAIDPTTGLPIAAAPPAEAVDINSIVIKINPPLLNVRLVDALDAIVKVADHPIRYTITDYAVVFSLRAPESSMNEPLFPGAAPGFAPALP